MENRKLTETKKNLLTLAFLLAITFFFAAIGPLADESKPALLGALKNAPQYAIDLKRWKITLPDGSERNTRWLVQGNTEKNQFYYNADGSIVFRSPSIAGTTANSKYSRSELREMLRGSDTSIKTKGLTKNNWVFSTADADVKQRAGAVDGILKAKLQVDHVSTTGDRSEVGTVIIGQIHASDDEPLRLHYRKLPNNTKGSIYFAHEIPRGDDTWHEIIGSMANDAKNPTDGIALGEIFNYEVRVRGLELTVIIQRHGKPDTQKTITMKEGYNNDWMYFKAGVYNQSNQDFTPNQSDYVQATFYELKAVH